MQTTIGLNLRFSYVQRLKNNAHLLAT